MEVKIPGIKVIDSRAEGKKGEKGEK